MTSRHDTQLGRATCRPGTRTAHNNTSGKKIERKTRCFFYSSRRCRPCVSVGLAVGLYAADNHLNISTIAVVVGRVPLSCQTGCSCQLSQHSLPSPPPPPPPLPPPPPPSLRFFLLLFLFLSFYSSFPLAAFMTGLSDNKNLVVCVCVCVCVCTRVCVYVCTWMAGGRS